MGTAASGILRRFRFHGVPGAPSAVGVPVDRAAEIAVELAPVLAALDETQRRAGQIVAGAGAQAARRRAGALAEAGRLVAEARAGAEVARATALAEGLATAEEERLRLLDAGRAEADRVATASDSNLGPLAEEVVRRALGLVALDGDDPDGGGPGR